MGEQLGSLEEREVRVVLARIRTESREELTTSGIEARIGAERMHLGAVVAVAADRRQLDNAS